MKVKEFGKTGINLSVFGFGGAKFRNGKTNEENAERVLYAINKGINHFDSGVEYTNSEEIFGLAINQSKREALYVSTKNQPAFFKTKQQQLDEIMARYRSLGHIKRQVSHCFLELFQIAKLCCHSIIVRRHITVCFMFGPR